MTNKQTKRILQVITLSEWGGAGRQVFELAENFKDKGYEVAIAVGGDKNGELINKLLAKKIKVYYLKYLQRKVNFYNDWFAFWQLLKVFRKYKPDIAHLHSSKAGSLGAITAKMARIKKVIYTVHGLVLNEPLSPLKYNFYKIAEKVSARYKNTIICVSEFDKESLLKNKIAGEKKIKVIYNGINLDQQDFFAREDAKNKLSKLIGKLATESKVLIGTIANFYETKGLVYLIEAAREIKEMNYDIKFVIVGDGPERKKLEKLIENYKLREIVFLAGSIPEASKYLKAFDIFVLPSQKEGFPYALLEASAAQLPIIATKVGGVPEIIKNNENGILIPSKNFEALSEAIINLAQNKALMNHLILESKNNVKRFGLKEMIERIEEIYKK